MLPAKRIKQVEHYKTSMKGLRPRLKRITWNLRRWDLRYNFIRSRGIRLFWKSFIDIIVCAVFVLERFFFWLFRFRFFRHFLFCKNLKTTDEKTGIFYIYQLKLKGTLVVIRSFVKLHWIQKYRKCVEIWNSRSITVFDKIIIINKVYINIS